MLIRLTPEQIVFYWERIRPLLLENLIPKVELSPENVFGILKNLLTESIQLWVGIEKEEGDILENIYGFIATTIDTDANTRQRNLMIYSLFAVKEIPITAWEEGLKVLIGYKELNNCKTLIAYTDNPGVVRLANKLGFRVTSFLCKE